MVIRLKDVPSFQDDPEAASRWIDEFISAIMPEEDQEDPYFLKVKTHMTHKCAVASNGCKVDADGVCKRGYDATILRPSTTFNERGFPQYKRINPADLRVVPHNRKMLLDWDGHINVEYAGSSLSVLYIYSYLFKGAKKAKLFLEGATDYMDEIKMFIRGRFLCSMDAFWRLLGFQTYPAAEPICLLIKVIDEPTSLFFLREKGSFTDLQIYMSRPEILRHLSFTELFAKYIVYKQPRASLRDKEDEIDGFFRIQANSEKEPQFLCRRTADLSLVRMKKLPLSSGDIWYLRLILQHTKPLRWADAKKVNGIRYTSYQLAAVALGLVTNADAAIIAFREYAGETLPYALRALFTTMTIDGEFPTLCIYEDEECRRFMMQDFLDRGATYEIATNELLKDLAQRFLASDKDLTDYGLPKPRNISDELSIELTRYDKKEQFELFQELTREKPLNVEQQQVFDDIFKIVMNHKPGDGNKYIMLQAAGGTGKTTVSIRLQAALRAEGKMVLVCAANTLAATLYDHAYTAHALHKFPVVKEYERDIENPPQCQLRNTPRLELLNTASAICWDEAYSNSKEILESAVQFVKDVVYIDCSDIRQTLPIVENGTADETIQQSLVGSHLWPQFNIFKLTTNMRLLATGDQSQISYAESILAIGEGRSHPEAVIVRRMDENTTSVALKNQEYIVHSEDSDASKFEALNWLYPSQDHDPTRFPDSCILAITNTQVNEWNAFVQEHYNRFPGGPKTLWSHDYFTDVDDPHGYLARTLDHSILSEFNTNDAPPHRLLLKVNDICRIMRPMKSSDLATNSLVQILHIGRAVIKVRVLTGKKQVVLIPRMKFSFTLKYGRSFNITRTQFPLCLAYAMSVNKSQGQTKNRILQDARIEAFAHGQTYVARSRVTDRRNIKVYITKEQLENVDGVDCPVIVNVVYPQTLSFL